MSYFVIGVSGVTCSGKTTLTKLLQRSFPWARTIHQDSYFYDDDYPGHVRVLEVENHVNYEVLGSMDMPKMYNDIRKVLKGPGEFFDGRDKGSQDIPDATATEDVPNFDSGLELLKSVGPLEFDTTKYKHIPILIIEGFILFESQYIVDSCDVRVFLTLSEEECRSRRSSRCYNPPDCPGYFDKIVWPEYTQHLEQFVSNRPGVIRVFLGTEPIQNMWRDSLQIIGCRLDEKYFMGEESQNQNHIA